VAAVAVEGVVEEEEVVAGVKHGSATESRARLTCSLDTRSQHVTDRGRNRLNFVERRVDIEYIYLNVGC
jgi:hypothetical protein